MSVAAGRALAAKQDGTSFRSFVVLGDGECNEGQIWEAVQSAVHYQLENMYIFVDWNKKQLDGTLEQISNPVDLAGKFAAFGFACETVPGYDVKAIWEAIERAKAAPGKPHCILLDTIKGLGVQLAEVEDFNHYLTFDEAKGELSVAEIERRLAEGTYPGGDFKW